ncbi:MAG: hypothetical protein KPEEDBHJ_01377 [Anaerolineales bacterium]|nr:hypothetical protein [Anaerolineales bacterium]
MLLKKPGGNIHWILPLVALLLIVLAYYWYEWRTFTNFVQAIDHHSQFMQDFVGHYYPMGMQILHYPSPVGGYFYTSFFALMLVPIGTQTLLTAMIVWGAIQLACLAAFCIFSARGLLELPPLKAVLFIGLCITSFPILHNVKWGQVSILITVCVLAAFLASKKNKPILAGILLGFASAIKLYPAYYIVYFILKRDVRACLSFGLSAFVFYFAFPAAVIGVHNWSEFEKAANSAVTTADWVSEDVNSQYIVHVGLRWVDEFFNTAAGDNLSEILAIAGYMIALSSIAVVWLLQKNAAPEEPALSLVALFLAVPFVLKTSWPHYFVYLPFCQTAILCHLARHHQQPGIWGKALYVFPVSSMLLSSIFIFNLFPDWAIYNSHGMLFLENLLLLVSVYIITAQQRVSSKPSHAPKTVIPGTVL